MVRGIMECLTPLNTGIERQKIEEKIEKLGSLIFEVSYKKMPSPHGKGISYEKTIRLSVGNSFHCIDDPLGVG